MANEVCCRVENGDRGQEDADRRILWRFRRVPEQNESPLAGQEHRQQSHPQQA